MNGSFSRPKRRSRNKLVCMKQKTTKKNKQNAAPLERCSWKWQTTGTTWKLRESRLAWRFCNLPNDRRTAATLSLDLTKDVSNFSLSLSLGPRRFRAVARFPPPLRATINRSAIYRQTDRTSKNLDSFFSVDAVQCSALYAPRRARLPRTAYFRRMGAQ